MLQYKDITTLAIVDDHPVVIEGVQKLLENKPGIQVAGSFTTGGSFHLISEGITTAGIAAQLSLSPLTIETHRRNLLQKFEVKNVAALIKIAVQQGLV